MSDELLPVMGPFEAWLKSFAEGAAMVIETLAVSIVIYSILKAFWLYVKSFWLHIDSTDIRLGLGKSLTLSLEFLLAADIIQTAVAPTWDDIGKLAAIATLRTLLNYFLERELKDNLKELNTHSDARKEKDLQRQP